MANPQPACNNEKDLLRALQHLRAECRLALASRDTGPAARMWLEHTDSTLEFLRDAWEMLTDNERS